MGKRLSCLRSNLSESLKRGTAKTDNTTFRGGQEDPVLLGGGTDKTSKTLISNFCQLVQHCEADRQYLLSFEVFMAGSCCELIRAGKWFPVPNQEV